MPAKYIIRLDDACPTMNSKKWNMFEKLLIDQNIKPIVAVIPNNKDHDLMVDKKDNNFWQKVKKWQDSGWHIALHGYEHLYSTKDAGLVPINNRSEFAGLTYETQRTKIEKGIEIFNEHNIHCNIWVAPSHSFDKFTIKALKDASKIRIISDGIAFYPFMDYNMTWIPQQLWSPRKMPFGTWTICLHPETTTERQFKKVADFIEKNQKSFVSINTLKTTSRKKNIAEKVFEVFYWKRLRKKQNTNNQ